MSAAASIELPSWALVTPARLAHIERVVRLLDDWAHALRVPADEASAWRDAGRLHDALRDAPEPLLLSLVPACDLPAFALHGPAAAARIAFDGERRAAVLEAVRWHTMGCASWERTGRALYMADYLEPGRHFERAERERLAAGVARDFEGVYREVVRRRGGSRGALRDHDRDERDERTAAPRGAP